jgi:uncharacterized protein YndB with AHSA1/START domain
MTMDRIEKRIELRVPAARVWRALTDFREFGQWFGAKMEAPFVAGEVARGQVTYPGYEHLRMEIAVEVMQPQTLFSFRWHPAAVDPEKDYTHERPTLVEFRLAELEGGGTLLEVAESGFDKLPVDRREAAYQSNEGGWTVQMQNIERYLAG